jgi:uncharacterized membrane protein YoaK (UPF0700 family)
MPQFSVTRKAQASGNTYPSKVAFCLATVAGYTDGYGLRQFNTFVSFMSGNTTSTGVSVAQRKFHSALPAAVAIFFFAGGAFLGHWIVLSKYRYSRRIVFLSSAVLMTVFVFLNLRAAFNAEVGIALLSVSMGIMNSAVARIGEESVNLTFVTGTLNKFGNHLALAARGNPPGGQGSWNTELRRAGLEGGLWLAFCTGAGLAGLATKRVGGYELIPPVAILFFFAFFGHGH